MKYDPTIKERSRQELLDIAICDDNYWQDEAIDLAKKELESRKVSRSELSDHIRKREEGKKNYEKWQLRKSRENATKGYTALSMLGIFFMAPWALLGRLRFGMNVFGLRRKNYTKKFNQRLLLIIGGMIFWITSLYIGARRAEQERIDEIENVDILDWEERMIK
jgi:hypothetical protein